ncbi:phage tail protein [Photobacterium swingsii]|uniref:phage tail protein n=1 Tax=Photobacterium swingsii TaxID=680026 RepID=UPI00352D8A1A
MSEPNNPFVSVQPENRTIIEEGLEYGWHKIISQQPNPYPNLKQPSYTPDEFVSLLAAERGVLDWQPSDTLEQRRKTAEQAFDIHRKAGTRSGITLALNALGFDAEVTRSTAPYSIDILCWRRNSTIDKFVVDRMISRIDHTKSERDSYELSLLFHSELNMAITGAVPPSINIHPMTIKAAVIPRDCIGEIATAAVSYSINVSNVHAQASIG